MGDKFKIVLAFSRESSNKVYVQHRLKEYGEYVNELMEKKQANVYVCGEAANMAREVKATLVQIIATQRAVGALKAEEILNVMRSGSQYQVSILFSKGSCGTMTDMARRRTSGSPWILPIDHSKLKKWLGNGGSGASMYDGRCECRREPYIGVALLRAALVRLHWFDAFGEWLFRERSAHIEIWGLGLTREFRKQNSVRTEQNQYGQ